MFMHIMHEFQNRSNASRCILPATQLVDDRESHVFTWSFSSPVRPYGGMVLLFLSVDANDVARMREYAHNRNIYLPGSLPRLLRWVMDSGRAFFNIPRHFLTHFRRVNRALTAIACDQRSPIPPSLHRAHRWSSLHPPSMMIIKSLYYRYDYRNLYFLSSLYQISGISWLHEMRLVRIPKA